MNARSVLFAALAACLAGSAGADPAPAPTYIFAGRLLADPATGAVTTAQTIVVEAGKITRIEAGYAAPAGATVIDLKDRFVLPGLTDSHVHLTSELGPSQFMDEVTKSSAAQAMIGVVNARKTVEAGFTTVADLGAANDAIFGLRRAIRENRVVGPRIIASGAAITPDGGHADANGFAPDIIDVMRSPAACSGADDCRRATRRQIQAGADVIKITATGGVLSNTAAGVAQQLSDEELRAIVDAAHAMGRRVTAHAHGVGGINAALRAGVDSIEHGTYLDAEGMRLIRQGNRYLVPTLEAGWWVAQLADRGGVLTPAQADKARVVGRDLQGMAARARAGNVRIAFGTDTGVSVHGENAREFQLLVQAGFTPLQTIQFATVAAADHLQLNSITGRIVPGLSADIIAVDGDPLADVSTLMNVRYVMARGVTHKSE
jgi:imidazolonepropionase-like amidohydrolase